MGWGGGGACIISFNQVLIYSFHFLSFSLWSQVTQKTRAVSTFELHCLVEILDIGPSQGIYHCLGYEELGWRLNELSPTIRKQNQS